MFFRRQHLLFVPLGNDRFQVTLDPSVRQGLLGLADQLDEVQTSDRPEARRLFPTAYTDDPERDAGYQVFARDQLIEKRRAAVEIMRTTAGAEELSGEELSAWMGVLNDLRLVLGTVLDVSEDDIDIQPDDPQAETHLLYRFLSELVHEMVESLTTGLPEPEDEG